MGDASLANLANAPFDPALLGSSTTSGTAGNCLCSSDSASASYAALFCRRLRELTTGSLDPGFSFAK